MTCKFLFTVLCFKFPFLLFMTCKTLIMFPSLLSMTCKSCFSVLYFMFAFFLFVTCKTLFSVLCFMFAFFLSMTGIPSESKFHEMITMRRANTRSDRNINVGPMWSETRQLLYQFYKPFNALLAELLQDRRFDYGLI